MVEEQDPKGRIRVREKARVWARVMIRVRSVRVRVRGTIHRHTVPATQHNASTMGVAGEGRA